MSEGAILSAPGTPCWVSLMVHGLDTTEEFYRGLFGWAFEEGPRTLGAYRLAHLDGGQVAGIGAMAPERRLPVAWTPYLATDDADAATELVRCCGGTVAVGPLDADAAGRKAICSDPAGAVFGVWQPRQPPEVERRARPGTPVWNDLLVAEPTMVAKFYELVFGYDVRSEGDTATLYVQDRPVASVCAAGEETLRETGPRWTTHFGVADVDASVARAVELGGRLVREPHETAAGRMAEVADVEGARFTLVRTPH
ncbi:VOC family protein [Streptomyces sp. CMB-StM0423]|uniref:VOC family protein n=1 Tax=Streptomyces sp. CMB-StM0423 TaxID=2059884 RepID=UPI001F3D6EC4|nr:VOC family protein [Streptomyces sp. CMB-StM0423]